MASAALVLVPLLVLVLVPVLVALALRPWGRTGPASSHSSRAPSARTQAEGRLGGAVPRRRSRSSGPRAPRGDPDVDAGAAVSKSPSRRVTSRAPRRATLPHCFARLGNGWSLSRVREEGRARGPSPDGVRVVLLCGGWPRESLPDLEPERPAGGEPLPVPRAGRAPAPSPGRAVVLRRASPVRARPGFPDPAREAPAPVPRLDPVVPDVRRSALPLDRVEGRPLPPPAAPRPCAPLPRPATPDPPERVAGRPGRAGWARRFGRGEFGGIGRFYVAHTAASRRHLPVWSVRPRSIRHAVRRGRQRNKGGHDHDPDEGEHAAGGSVDATGRREIWVTLTRSHPRNP